MEDFHEESFRDSIATVNEDGSRNWVYPKKPKGRYYDKRKVLSYILLIIFFAMPFIHYHGEQLILFNILERKFVFFGYYFGPEDFHIFALVSIVGIVFIALFTVIFGRLFCGWICPQTIFMEMVFRRIEYWIEGDWKAQARLDKSKWTKDKIRKKVIKHCLFWSFSFIIANLFLAYIIGSDELFKIVIDSPFQHLGGLVAITVFTTIFYLIFSKMREQVCIAICPYGRLQGVLLDSNSLVVAYNDARGEGEKGRARFKKNEDRSSLGKGDCIDCHQCVNVCPTGIDIRHGTQLECVNCTACIDACDTIMDAVGLEKGLVGYASENNIKEGTKFKITTRIKVYIIVLIGLIFLLVGILFNRTDFRTDIFRTRGTLYQTPEPGIISNIYDVSFHNMTNDSFDVKLQLMEKDLGTLKMIGQEISLGKLGEIRSKFLILIPKVNLIGRKKNIHIGVFKNGEKIKEIKTSFLGPAY